MKKNFKIQINDISRNGSTLTKTELSMARGGKNTKPPMVVSSSSGTCCSVPTCKCGCSDDTCGSDC